MGTQPPAHRKELRVWIKTRGGAEEALGLRELEGVVSMVTLGLGQRSRRNGGGGAGLGSDLLRLSAVVRGYMGGSLGAPRLSERVLGERAPPAH